METVFAFVAAIRRVYNTPPSSARQTTMSQSRVDQPDESHEF